MATYEITQTGVHGMIGGKAGPLPIGHQFESEEEPAFIDKCKLVSNKKLEVATPKKTAKAKA